MDGQTADRFIMPLGIFADGEINSFEKKTFRNARNNVQTFVNITLIKHCEIDKKLKPTEPSPLKCIDVLSTLLKLT